MKPNRTLAILTVVGLLTLGLNTVASAQDSSKMSDTSGSISNLVANYPDVYPTRYEKSGASIYTYQITFNDSIDSFNNQKCILTLDGALIKSDTCAIIIAKESNPAPTPVSFGGGIDLSSDGNYVLTANGNALASWTFKRSPELPPKTSECIIKSVKAIKIKNRVMSLTIVNNGKCTDGAWYYTYSGDPKEKGYAISNLGKNNYGKSLSAPLIMSKGSIVTVSFLSNDFFGTSVQKKFALK